MSELYKSPEVYDVVFSWDPITESTFYRDLVRTYYRGPLPSLRAIEFGSGTGRVLSILSGLRYDTLGLELSEEMAIYAYQKLEKTTDIVRGDMSQCPFRSRAFHVAFSTLSTINYLPSVDLVRRHLSCAYRLLSNRGIYIADFIIGLPDHRFEKWALEREGVLYQVAWRLTRVDAPNGVMEESITVHRQGELFAQSRSKLSYVAKSRFEHIARDAGFKVSAWFQPFEREPISSTCIDGRVIVVLAKTPNLRS